MDWSEEEFEQVLDGVSRLGWLVLKRFSTTYKPSDILAAFGCLRRNDFELLRRLHFATSEVTKSFLDDHVLTFLKTTPATTEHVIEDRRGSPRARIDWMRTYAKRSQAGSDQTRFVTRPIERTADTGAARLFAYLLARVEANADWVSKRSVPEIARERLLASKMRASRNLATLRGRGVRVPTRMTPRDVSPMRKSRRPDVVAAVQLYDAYVQLVEMANENLLRNLLRKEQMAPENLDDLFEIWTLLTFVSRHLDEGWTIDDARLIGGDIDVRRPRFTLRKGGGTAEIYFQTVPGEMAKYSAYKSIFRDYDLDAAMRRPDITADVSLAEGLRQRLIVEVKRTEDRGYILDSVYKTLGYLADFKNTIGPNAPFAFLVVWKGIQRLEQAADDAPIRILTHAEFERVSLPY